MLPLHLYTEGRLALVVGAGPVGRRRIDALRAAGLNVRVVDPALGSERLAGVETVADAFVPAHLEGVSFALACAPAEVNAAVVRAARERRIWVGRADAGAPAGDFAVPAVVRRDGLLLSISSGAPAATARLRRALEDRVPEAWGRFAGLLAELRARLPRGARARRLTALANGPLLDMLEAGDEAAARRLVESASE